METSDPRRHSKQQFSHSDQSPKFPIDDSPRRFKRSRPTNRPGFNSYLKVILDDATMNILHKMSLVIQEQIQQVYQTQSSIERPEENVEQIAYIEPPSSPARKDSVPLTYRPRARNSLHMTLFFGGETLCALPHQELVNWHGRISQRLEQSGFFLKGHGHERESVDGTVHDFGFRVVGLKIFPPKRNNLVVAILEPKDEWHDLYKDLREIAQDESCSPELASIAPYSKEMWIAHVTLGNLVGGNNCDRKNLDKILLESVFDTTCATFSMSGAAFEATTQGIGMGGPIPGQVELDWDFHFSGTNKGKGGIAGLS